jgi:hypothetical protein
LIYELSEAERVIQFNTEACLGGNKPVELILLPAYVFSRPCYKLPSDFADFEGQSEDEGTPAKGTLPYFLVRDRNKRVFPFSAARIGMTIGLKFI